MPKLTHVAVEDKIVTVGDKFKVTENGYENGLGRVGNIVTIHCIREEDDGRFLIGLYSKVPISNWNNLENSVEEGQGYWVRSNDINSMLTQIGSCVVVIAKDFKFKKHNLKGMQAKLLCRTSFKTSCFIELEEDVGGGSADGTGKAGHCVVVPSEVLSNRPIIQKLKEVKSKEQ